MDHKHNLLNERIMDFNKVEYGLARKRNQLIRITVWTNLKNLMVNERNQIQEVTLHD